MIVVIALFLNRIWVNDLVGHIMTLPIIYPFHAWRILHNYHHKHTNKLDVDNAWAPFTPETYDNCSPAIQWLYRRMRGWFWGVWFNYTLGKTTLYLE